MTVLSAIGTAVGTVIGTGSGTGSGSSTAAAEPAAASLVQSVDWLAIAPVAITAAVALGVLVADLFVPERRKPQIGRAHV